MKNLAVLCFVVCFCSSLQAQIHLPTGGPGSSSDPSKVMIGSFVAPANYDAQLFVNTRVGSANSSLTNLLLNYSLSSYSGGARKPPHCPL